MISKQSPVNDTIILLNEIFLNNLNHISITLLKVSLFFFSKEPQTIIITLQQKLELVGRLLKQIPDVIMKNGP